MLLNRKGCLLTRLVKHLRNLSPRFFSPLAHIQGGSDTKYLVSQVQQKDSLLHVHWNDRSVSRFPYIYLGDICNCPKCVDATSLQRKLDTVGQIDLDIQAKSVNISEDGLKYFFDVFAKFDANNVAYTTKALPPHCDLVQTEYYPGAQFLHCLVQIPTEGGSNTFADGFKVAQDFKKMEPELFRLMSDRPIPHVDVGVDVFGEYHVENSRPVFEIDHNGKIRRLTHNNHVRDYRLNNPPEEVCQVYKGYKLLEQMMRDPENSIDHKMEAGEMATFNNSRVFHGRTEFTPTNVGDRHLQGSYLDWDLMYARLRSLGQSLGRPFHE